MIKWLKRLFSKPKQATVVPMDARTAKNLATLDPKAQPVFQELWDIGNAVAKKHGCTYVMISGNRTYAEQNALYAQGRTTGGKKVTNAKAGYSNHNFGIAADFGVFRGGKYLDSDSPDMAARIHKEVAAAGKNAGLNIEWGGDWKTFKDIPHYELITGLTMAQKRSRMAERNSVL